MIPPLEDIFRNVERCGLRRCKAAFSCSDSDFLEAEANTIVHVDLSYVPPGSVPLGVRRTSPFFQMRVGRSPIASHTGARSQLGCSMRSDSSNRCRFIALRRPIVPNYSWRGNCLSGLLVKVSTCPLFTALPSCPVVITSPSGVMPTQSFAPAPRPLGPLISCMSPRPIPQSSIGRVPRGRSVGATVAGSIFFSSPSDPSAFSVL